MTIRESRLTIRALQPVVAGLDALGYDASRLLDRASIPPTVLAGDPDGTVPHGAMMTLWKLAGEATGDENLGIHLAEAAAIGSFEVHAYALLSSPTLRAAFRRACRYQRLIHDSTELVFDEGPEEGVLSHARPGGLPVPRQAAEFLVTVWLRFARLILDEDWLPTAVRFAHEAPGDLSEHRRLFGDRVFFSSGRTALHVPTGVLDVTNARRDDHLVRTMDRYAEKVLRWAPSRATVSGRVRAQLVETLGSGVPTAGEVARQLNLSARTLQRALGEEGASFRQVLEQLRRERATDLLADRHCSIAEIGFLVGFSELSAFYRAFKRWTGKTPAEFRDESRPAVSPSLPASAE